MQNQVAHAHREEAVELGVRGDALVEGFVFAEDVFEVAGGDGGGVAVDEAHAREHDVIFAEACPVGVAGPEGDGEGVGGAAGVGFVVLSDGFVGAAGGGEAA